jgi:hypothetical protein
MLRHAMMSRAVVLGFSPAMAPLIMDVCAMGKEAWADAIEAGGTMKSVIALVLVATLLSLFAIGALATGARSPGATPPRLEAV